MMKVDNIITKNKNNYYYNNYFKVLNGTNIKLRCYILYNVFN